MPALAVHRRHPLLNKVLGNGIAIVITLFLLLALTLFVGQVMPVDPVQRIVGEFADQASYDAAYHRLGLDQPVMVQFWHYLVRMCTGDFGSAIMTGKPILQDLMRVFPATIELATVAVIIGAGLGIPLGVLSAVERGKPIDHVVRLITLTGHSIPNFWLSLMGLMVFYAMLGWVGGQGRVDIYFDGLVPTRTGLLLIDSLIAGEMDVFWNAVSHIILPASILGLASMAYLTRMTRSFMLEQLSQEYIITARVKGLSKWAVVWGHAFLNIRVQLVTIIALAYANLLEGTVLVETVFSWPGFGQYLTTNLLVGDMNAIMVCVLLVGIIFIGLNMLADALYRVLDPRTRK
ncbi:MAG TPA: ABC transporter permease [Devosiaceae bacterium]|jgi:peptide/nickel transport system permease protein